MPAKFIEIRDGGAAMQRRHQTQRARILLRFCFSTLYGLLYYYSCIHSCTVVRMRGRKGQSGICHSSPPPPEAVNPQAKRDRAQKQEAFDKKSGF